jgi:hypothetical protein
MNDGVRWQFKTLSWHEMTPWVTGGSKGLRDVLTPSFLYLNPNVKSPFKYLFLYFAIYENHEAWIGNLKKQSQRCIRML